MEVYENTRLSGGLVGAQKSRHFGGLMKPRTAAERLAYLDGLIPRLQAARRPNLAYLGARLAERERLLAEVREAELEAAKEMVAGRIAEGRLAPEPEPVPEPVPWTPTPEEILDDGFDVGKTLDGLLSFLGKDGLRVLKRKARRGDLEALKLIGTISRMLISLDETRRGNCPAPCCKRQRRPAREVRLLDRNDPVAMADAEAREARGEVTIFRPGWPAAGDKA
jgi:hypothetical protein